MENLRIQLKVDDADVENVDMVRRNQELANANPVPKKVGEAADVGRSKRSSKKRCKRGRKKGKKSCRGKPGPKRKRRRRHRMGHDKEEYLGDVVNV